MIFSLSIDRNVALLNAIAQSFDNVTFLIDENGGMIPTCRGLSFSTLRWSTVKAVSPQESNGLPNVKDDEFEGDEKRRQR